MKENIIFAALVGLSLTSMISANDGGSAPTDKVVSGNRSMAVYHEKLRNSRVTKRTLPDGKAEAREYMHSEPGQTQPSLPVVISSRSLRETICKELFRLQSMNPDELLVSDNVKITFADLRNVAGAPGERGRIIGLSGGTSGTVEVEQPDGTTIYMEKLEAEKLGMKILRVVQGPRGSMRVHSSLDPAKEMPYIIVHEFGHIAVKMFGTNASVIVNDAASTAEESKRLHSINTQLMVPCKKILDRLGKEGK